MANETNAVAEFLKDEPKEKSMFEPEKTIFSEETPKEEETKEEEVQAEKSLPFHKDPKVQRYVEKKIAKALEAAPKPTEVQQFKSDTEDEITDVLVRIIGNDTPEKQSAIKDFRKVLGSLEEKGANKALAEFKRQVEEQAEEDRRALRELNESFEEIEETYDVDLSSNTPAARKIRSEFVAYVTKIAPKNEEGEPIAYPDMNSAFEEFQERSKRVPSNTKAKELASRGMSRSTDASQAPATGPKNWGAVDKLFSKLSS